jgi:hypothetical protein
MAGALVPIAWYFVSSARQQANIQAEAIAAAYAGKVMNELLTETPFDQLDGALGETVEIDGTTIQWAAQVGDPGDFGLTFAPVDGGADETENLSTLDAKFATDGWFRDIVMTVQWQGPRDDTMGGTSRTQVLVTRRARL